MILDEKVLNPPPPNTKAPSPSIEWRTFSALPPHLLLQVVYATFSEAYDIEEQRKTLYWLAISLRLVNRPFYTTSMNVLRSVYLPAYNSLIRPSFTSDPFPRLNSHWSMRASLFSSVQRETVTLDLFIALKVREDVWSDDSELHLERHESFADLFNLMQPRSRLEDLVRDYGVVEGLVYVDKRPPGQRTPASSKSTRFTITPLPFSALSAAFSSRRVGLVLTTPGSKRTVVEVARTRDEQLEVAARRLVWALRDCLVDEADGVL
ncbi:hypothetical protein GGX14DRAFT_550372 [Mycena pura]|uniref:Uncharacterized protein n=1 Tax=Mycena pura TaxID=153505 RepID=A0AAD6VQK2_9AGAR|nr:hypothetical protein GGX14DRAFT_550372 [Mycena pura]